MWAVIKAFFTNNAIRVLEILVAVLGAVGAVAAIYRSGEKAQEAKQLELDLKRAGEANAIHDKNRAELSDGDAAKRLRDEWSR
jgi:hypothetical protein